MESLGAPPFVARPSRTSIPGGLASGLREATLRELARDREEVRERGSTFATCIVGAPELGKGMVVEAALREAELGGFETLLCRAERDDATTPLSLFRAAITSWRPSASSRTGEREEEKGEDAKAMPPSFGTSLVLEAALAPETSSEAEPGSISGEVEHERLMNSLADPNQTALDKRARLLTQIRTFLVDRARQTPLVLALEDLQLADRVSADLVAVLLEWRPNAPLWILLSYTSEEELYAPLRRALERDFLSRAAVRRVIQPLSAGEMRLFLLDTGEKTPLPGGVLDEIVHRAQGLPGVALRLAHGYLTHGSLPGAEPGEKEGIPDPLASLSEEQERVLALAAVVGAAAGFELLRRAAGTEEERMAELLEELVLRGVLSERSGGVYAFQESEVREKVYHGLTQARRRVLHRKVAEAWEGLPGPLDAAKVFALAHHFTEGRSDEKALQYLQQARRFAQQAGSLTQELEILGRLLDVHRRFRPKDHRGEAELLHSSGTLSYALGSDEDAMRSLSRARDLLQNLHEGGPTYAAVLLDLARVTVRQGDLAVASSLAQESLERFQKADDALGAAAVRRFRTRLLYSEGDYAAAEAELKAGLEETKRGQGSAVEIGRILTALADIEFSADHQRRAEATKDLEDGIKILLEVGDKAGALFAILGRAAIECSLGEPAEYERTMARVRRLMPEVPEVWRLTDSMLRKGGNHIAKGEIPEALGLGTCAADTAAEMHDAERQGRALIFAVDAAGRMGNMERALELAQKALAVGEASSHRRTQAEALVRLAVAAHMSGDDARSRELLERSESLAKGIEVSRTAQMLRRDLKETLGAGDASGAGRATDSPAPAGGPDAPPR